MTPGGNETLGDRVTDRPSGPLWVTVQVLAVGVTVVLIGGLIWRPELSLSLLWNVVVPLVPATLLISPLIWRNVCPLATLNMAGNGLGLGRRSHPTWVARANVAGMVLFALLVPARRFLFNAEGPALATTIAGVGGGALLLGLWFDGRAGFCNAMCPVLPVERLYGQSPLMGVERARCSTCSACGRGCLDLAPRRSVFKLTSRTDGAAGWLFTPMGFFAGAFPGFVFGYFTITDGPLSTAGGVYAWIAATSAGSYLVTIGASRLSKADATRVLPVLAAAGAALYYWFASPSIQQALGVPATTTVALRAAALGLVGWWVVTALGRRDPRPNQGGSPQPRRP